MRRVQRIILHVKIARCCVVVRACGKRISILLAVYTQSQKCSVKRDSIQVRDINGVYNAKDASA